jgi:hypothetical protein
MEKVLLFIIGTFVTSMVWAPLLTNFLYKKGLLDIWIPIFQH